MTKNKEHKDLYENPSTLIYLYKLVYGEPESYKEEFQEQRLREYQDDMDCSDVSVESFKELYEKKVELEKNPNTTVEICINCDDEIYLEYSGPESDEAYEKRKENYKKRIDRLNQDIEKAKEVFKDLQLFETVKNYYENISKLKKRRDNFFFKMEDDHQREKDELKNLELNLKKLKEKKELHSQILKELNLNI